MQLVSNSKLIRNRSRLGFGLYAFAVLILFVGWYFVTFRQDQTGELPYFAWVLMVAGLLLWSVAMAQIRRWGPQHTRATEDLAKAIRGLDDRYKLYAYASSDLPDYVLVGPSGVSAIVPKPEGGLAVCERDRWKKSGQNVLTSLFGQSFGNPSVDAQRALQRVRAVLTQAGVDDVPVGAMIVFTDPKAQLRVEGCSATVTKVSGLKDVLRKAAGKGQSVAVSAARVRDLQDIFDQRLQSASTWR